MAVLNLRPPTGGAMTCKIDYLSFTVPGGVGEGTPSDDWFNEVAARVSALMPGDAVAALAAMHWSPMPGMGRYQHSMRAKDAGIGIYYGGQAENVLVQMAGTACQLFSIDGAMSDVLLAVHERVTRLDIAVDIDVQGLSPANFVAYGYAERFKSGGSVFSETGTTEYIGSRQSERFCRVYRYADPHPRAALLRVEFELKGGYAKRAARALLDGSVSGLARTLGDAFGFEHPAWDASQLAEATRPTSRGEREGSGSIMWLHKAVLPALVKLHRAGIFNVRSWVEDVVLPALDESDGEKKQD